MSRDAAIESWLASMSESELIDQCFFWQGMALEHGRMYNSIKDENAKLHDMVVRLQSVVSDGADNARELRAEDAKLRELVARLARAIGADSEWADPECCDASCAIEFRCMADGIGEVRCPVVSAMRELGIEVDE